jgi:tripartite-type tricarboxylate transporter receptor subunit TctC
MTSTQKLQLAAVVLCAVLNAANPASAQSYPSKPIKLVVPLPAGGTVDSIARVLAQGLSSRLGQSVVIDNRPGAGTTIGLKAVAAADPDGYTLLLGSSGSLAINPALYTKLDFSGIKALIPVAALVTIPNVLVVAPSIPAKNVAELVAYSKANPQRLHHGASLGTPPHLMGEYFRIKSGADIAYVPYKGTSNALGDLLGGHLQLVSDSLATLLPTIREGKVRPLVVTSATRLPELPDVPTLVEVGIAGYPEQTWMGLVAPAKTPNEIVNKLNTVVNEMLASADIKASLANLGFEPRAGSPQDFGAFIASETEKWAAVVKVTGVQGD